MSKFKSYFKSRYNVLVFIFAFIYLAIVAQLANLQIFQGKEYDVKSRQTLSNEVNMMAPRGSILDRNGVIIASNKEAFNILITKKGVSTQELNAQVLKVINIIEKNGDSYIDSFNNYIKPNLTEYGSAILSSKAIKDWEKTLSSNLAKETNTPKSTYMFLKNKYEISNQYSDADAYKIMCIRYEIMSKGWPSVNSVRIAKDVKKETIAEIEERKGELTSFITEEFPIRCYTDDTYAAHITGYLGKMNAEEYSKLSSKGYKINDYIGKSGIEGIAEQYLKGSSGSRVTNINLWSAIGKQISDNPVVRGSDVVLTIDMRLQKVATESLARTIEHIKKGINHKNNFGDASSGAAVVLDPRTGEVLAMVSFPTFSPSVYVEEPNNKKAQELKQKILTDPNSPLLNRATQGMYAPGSTYKPITAIAGLEEGVITPDTVIRDDGIADIGGHRFYCLEYKRYHWTHGNLVLNKALATSCNIYFHILGSRIGIDKLDKWAGAFGLGYKTGIEVPEIQGLRANRQSKKKILNDAWGAADTAQSAIGQSQNMFTPIQLANYISTISNGGKKFTPYIIKKIVDSNGSIVKETKPNYTQLSVSEQNINAVKNGMIAVANSSDGTAAGVFRGFPFQVAGKTGTAEIGSEATRSSNALFICYAPANDPEIAICVVIEHGVWGANVAPVAKDILQEYFTILRRNKGRFSTIQHLDKSIIFS